MLKTKALPIYYLLVKLNKIFRVKPKYKMECIYSPLKNYRIANASRREKKTNHTNDSGISTDHYEIVRKRVAP